MGEDREDHITRRLERLLEISRTLNSTLDLETLLDKIIQAACELIGCEASSILMVDEDGHSLLFAAAPDSHKTKLNNIPVPIEGSIAGKAFQECQPVIIRDGIQSPGIYRKVDEELAFHTRDLVAVPLVFKGQPVGVIEALNKRENNAFSEEDIHTLETLASHAATAIQNAKLIQEIQNAYRELEKLDRLKSDFISITSHELRTPLGLILGHTAFLRESTHSDEVNERVSGIEKSALRLKSIIEDLNHMDDYQQGDTVLTIRKIVIADLLQELLITFDDKILHKGISLATDLKQPNLVFEGDKKKILLIVGHLIDNAIAFTPEGGKILIRVESIPNQIQFSVIDNGIGIPAADLPYIFERFYQVENHMTRKHGGLGLGLSIAKSMVELHGGEIHAESLVHKGSKITFTLPVHPQKTTPGQQVFLD